jgi:hypothetical protein
LVRVSPNPVKANHSLSISWDKNEQAEISLLRLDGSLIKKETRPMAAGFNIYPCPLISSGIYILKIESPGKSIAQKLSVYQ